MTAKTTFPPRVNRRAARLARPLALRILVSLFWVKELVF